jgi:hypothetical protein
MGSTPSASLPSGTAGDEAQKLDLLPDDSWRDGLADPQTWAQNGLSNADALLMAKLRQLQTLTHTCDAPDCKAKFASADQLAVHQETTHTQWPSGTNRQQPSVQEDQQALRSALMNAEREFSVMLQELIPNLHRSTANRPDTEAQRATRRACREATANRCNVVQWCRPVCKLYSCRVNRS